MDRYQWTFICGPGVYQKPKDCPVGRHVYVYPTLDVTKSHAPHMRLWASMMHAEKFATIDNDLNTLGLCSEGVVDLTLFLCFLMNYAM
eukprot:8501150-Karenia_brevis.AAC.1